MSEEGLSYQGTDSFQVRVLYVRPLHGTNVLQTTEMLFGDKNCFNNQ